MPPKRRQSTLATQKTLAFGPRNKVTKPSTSTSAFASTSKKPKPYPLSQTADSKKAPSTATPSPALTSDDETTDSVEAPIEKEPLLPPKSPGGRTIAIREVHDAAAANTGPAKKKSELEEEERATAAAARVGEAELKRYWKAKEEERKAKRVHQEDLTINEKILRHFDISSQYGPCIGIARMKRWKRADGLGLNPPVEVLAVLLKEQQQQAARKTTTQSKDADRAYLDDLLSARIGVD
ncbi:hypothetical protein MMC29_000731 [Sticta canariensis]|nr:hypothetical protein [Sticta canariensis]